MKWYSRRAVCAIRTRGKGLKRGARKRKRERKRGTLLRIVENQDTSPFAVICFEADLLTSLLFIVCVLS